MELSSETKATYLCPHGRALKLPRRWKGVTPAIDISTTLILATLRFSYETSPIFNVLRRAAAWRDVRPVQYVLSNGHKLAVAFLAAKASGTGPTTALMALHSQNGLSARRCRGTHECRAVKAI